MQRRSFHLAALAAAMTHLASGPQARADAARAAWPIRTVRLLVGFPAGSTPDMLARTLAEPLARALGQPVVVENRAGAGGHIAADLVAKAGDGHTLGIVGNGIVAAKVLRQAMAYDPAADFSFLSLLATAPLVLVAPANAPAGAAFFDAAARQGARWNYGSVGIGSMGHLGMEVLKARVPGLAPVHVPFKGNPDVLTSMVGGEIQMALVPPGVALPQVKAGRLKAIGLAGGRSTLAPEVPPLAEAGVRDFHLEVWAALVGPARLSPAAQARLAAEVPRIVRSPESRQALLLQGWQAVGTAPEGLKTRIRDDAALLQATLAGRGISLQ